ncbi:MAG: type IX secretion system membrane protein PorP/SprF [Bacteroidetes bacterium]|nr:type IX secretion system membrane protein PorP/SprF [Bacteroidota bacterium]
MYKKIIFSVFLIAGMKAGYSQHLPQYSQYFFNEFAINPAVAGTAKTGEARSTHRNQWAGITDAPRTFVLSAHGRIAEKNMGLGGNVFTDITGPTRRVGANFSYSYHLQLTENTKLAMGLSAGILQFGIDASKIQLRDPGDLSYGSNIQSATVPDFGAGLYLYNDKYFVGASAPQLYQSELKIFSEDSRSRLQNHYFVMAGYKLDLSDEFVLQPMVMVKHVKPVPVQIDLTARVIYQEKMWVGLTYRTHDAISSMIGFNYQEQLMFGYAFDYAVSGLQKYSSGTHELMLGVRFSSRK